MSPMQGRTRRTAAAVAIAAVVAVVSASCAASAPRGAFRVPDGPCADIALVSARGSSDPPASDEIQAMRDELVRAVAALRPGATVGAFELGDLDRDGVVDPGGYPAVGPLQAVGVDLGTDPVAEPWLIGGYNDSRRIGSEELVAVLTQLATRCPSQRTVVAGYSMGADAVATGLRDLPSAVAARVVAVHLFGDPRFTVGPWMRAPWAEFPSGHGILGGRHPYVPEGFVGRTASWCGQADGVCTGQLLPLLLQLLPVCDRLVGNPSCSRRHIDYGLWAIPAAMEEAARAALSGDVDGKGTVPPT
jgi:hypothetical protein